MGYANARRTDGGFFVEGRMVMRAGKDRLTGATVAVMLASGEAAQFPGLAVSIANLMNDAAGLDRIAVPKPKKAVA